MPGHPARAQIRLAIKHAIGLVRGASSPIVERKITTASLSVMAALSAEQLDKIVAEGTETIAADFLAHHYHHPVLLHKASSAVRHWGSVAFDAWMVVNRGAMRAWAPEGVKHTESSLKKIGWLKFKTLTVDERKAYLPADYIYEPMRKTNQLLRWPPMSPHLPHQLHLVLVFWRRVPIPLHRPRRSSRLRVCTSLGSERPSRLWGPDWLQSSRTSQPSQPIWEERREPFMRSVWRVYKPKTAGTARSKSKTAHDGNHHAEVVLVVGSAPTSSQTTNSRMRFPSIPRRVLDGRRSAILYCDTCRSARGCWPQN